MWWSILISEYQWEEHISIYSMSVPHTYYVKPDLDATLPKEETNCTTPSLGLVLKRRMCRLKKKSAKEFSVGFCMFTFCKDAQFTDLNE